MATILIGIMLLGAVVLIVWRMVDKKKKKKSGCNSCEGCPGCL